VLDMTNAKPAPRRPDAAAERPTPSTHVTHPLLAVMLDQVDHPMILLADDQNVLHANRAAQLELAGTAGHEHPLAWRDGKLTAVQRGDAAELADAMMAARTRDVRKLLALGTKDNRVSVSVMAMQPSEHDPHGAILLVMGKRQVCGDLAVFWFARSHGLTQAESTVLQSLCKGLGPGEIAQEHAVAISTVRTQLAAIRSKTGTTSLRDLVNEVACLPPLMHALGRTVTH
jgi:DNA-binding CsgD family transcriptional regulator